MTIDTDVMLLGFMALALAGVTLNAWRLGNERRDVALLGMVAGLTGLGAAAVAAG